MPLDRPAEYVPGIAPVHLRHLALLASWGTAPRTPHAELLSLDLQEYKY